MKIAASLEDVAGRLSKIEQGIPGVSNDGAWASRRKSSFRRSLRSSRLGSYNGPSLSPVPSEDLTGGDHESIRYYIFNLYLFAVIFSFDREFIEQLF